MKLIDKLFKEGQKAIDVMKKPFIIGKLERSFESAIASAEESKVDAEIELQKLRLKLIEEPQSAGNTINSIVKARETIKKADRTIELVSAEAKLLFGESNQ
jgi:hypothetical protein